MKKRILTVALVIALLATCFAGTYAYLQDQQAVKNTFTTGTVYISMDEAVVKKDDNGNLVADGTNRTTAEQPYHLYPGMVVTKDPTITLKAGSEDAWIAAKVTFEGYNACDLLSGGVWETDAVEMVVDGNVVYVYVKAVQAAGAKIVLFNKLTVPAAWGNDQMIKLNGMKINVEAYAVQANGFADCRTAMQTAFPGAFSANP